MSDPGPSTPSTPPEPPWWVGHPIVKVPALVALVTGVVAVRYVLHGDARDVGLGVLALFMAVGAIVGGVLLMRGIVPPLPNPRLQPSCPPAVMIMAVGFGLGGITLLVDVLVAPHDGWGPVTAGMWAAVATFVVGVVVQVMSWSDTWPDRWRPPYARARERGAGAPPSHEP